MVLLQLLQGPPGGSAQGRRQHPHPRGQAGAASGPGADGERGPDLVKSARPREQAQPQARPCPGPLPCSPVPLLRPDPV